MVVMVELQEEHGGSAGWAFQWVVSEGEEDALAPAVEGQEHLMLFPGDGAVELLVGFTMAGVKAVIADHLEMFFRDVADQPFDELQDGDGLGDEPFILVAVVMEGDMIAVIAVDP